MAMHAWFVHATDAKHRIIFSIAERCRRVIGFGSPLTECSRQPSNRKILRQTALAQHVLCQVGLSTGSPLPPLLFLFFNADLVQHKIALKCGSIVFIDDYSAWVTAPTAEANQAGIQAEDKTVIIYFTRHPKRTNKSPYITKAKQSFQRKIARSRDYKPTRSTQGKGDTEKGGNTIKIY
ncbi:Uncharacterized protein HZ326_9693 [Fusarium oxysporum f. sp. albedinis]|nr:Uncharacterized protein HZ326_9693 [Fusarium oxysporum f. sp. albedinis]